jgi:hypothetical protein
MLLGACKSEDPDRPPAGGLGGGSGFFPNSPQSGAGASGDGDGDDEGNILAGPLVSFVDDSFGSVVGYAEATDIRVLEAGGAQIAEGESENGSITLRVPESPAQLWTYAKPSADLSVLSNISHLYLGDAVIDVEGVPVVKEAIVSEIVGTTSSAPALNENSAQLVMRFLDKNEVPLTGVSVTYVEGAQDFTYAVGNTWSEFRDNTSAEGLVLFYNIPTNRFPGSLREVTVSGAMSGDFEVQLVAGAVTVVTFRASP